MNYWKLTHQGFPVTPMTELLIEGTKENSVIRRRKKSKKCKRGYLINTGLEDVLSFLL